MKKLYAFVLLIGFLLPFALSTAALNRTAKSNGDTTMYRDEYGIPHIFAPSLEAAAYAIGYAQAEDRLEELLKNYRRANGTMSEVFGDKYFRDDLLQRMWRHSEISREKYSTISPKMRAVIESYQEGIKQFMQEHPEQVPAWAQEIHPWDVIALSRYIIFGWPLGEAAGDLSRAGIQPDPMAYRGSNQMLIAAKRTTLNAPIAVIDPHLSWYDEFRFYQVRIYAPEFNVAGVSILGMPIPSLGHSRWCSIAMTTGGPDTSDVYEEELNPQNPRQYKYDGKWREMTIRKQKIGVKTDKGFAVKEVEIEYTHHGAVVAHKNGKAYAFAIPYAEEVGLSDEIYEMLTAKNLAEMKKALSRLQLMQQNVMVATVQGDLFYVRDGRVPIRAKGVDASQPVPGNTSATEWQGLHPFSDLVQITNPASGYMHNCNVTPFAMMKEVPKELQPETYAAAPYLYNASRKAPRHQRGEMMTQLLDAATKVNLEQALAIAFNPTVWKAETWQARLKEALAKAMMKPGEAFEVYQLIQNWNRRSDADSPGAMAFYAFKKGLGDLAKEVEPPATITDEKLLDALGQAAEWLKTTFGAVRVPYGTYFRVGRRGGDKTWPVGGGSLQAVGMATPRAISFAPVGKEMVGQGGQTSTQVVVMTNPPQSYAIIPLGESDHKESGHWDDQAEKLFSKSIAAPSYFLDKAELLKHVTTTKVFKRPLAAQAGR
ncbi:MAG: penicillin acylase family protein [Acidobacteria bacterium]|nr:penicillin acylase family protein [Acidobacteriota bacterium]